MIISNSENCILASHIIAACSLRNREFVTPTHPPTHTDDVEPAYGTVSRTRDQTEAGEDEGCGV